MSSLPDRSVEQESLNPWLAALGEEGGIHAAEFSPRELDIALWIASGNWQARLHELVCQADDLGIADEINSMEPHEALGLLRYLERRQKGGR